MMLKAALLNGKNFRARLEKWLTNLDRRVVSHRSTIDRDGSWRLMWIGAWNVDPRRKRPSVSFQSTVLLLPRLQASTAVTRLATKSLHLVFRSEKNNATERHHIIISVCIYETFLFVKWQNKRRVEREREKQYGQNERATHKTLWNRTATNNRFWNSYEYHIKNHATY